MAGSVNGTLQDRLVKELRLRGISSMVAANAFAPVFQADFNVRFARIPRRDFNAHRPLRADEDLDRIFTWREWRKVSHSLTLQYDKTLYLLADQPAHRALIHRYLEVAEYPDGRIELWADGATLPYTTYDRLAEIDQGAWWKTSGWDTCWPLRSRCRPNETTVAPAAPHREPCRDSRCGLIALARTGHYRLAATSYCRFSGVMSFLARPAEPAGPP